MGRHFCGTIPCKQFDIRSLAGGECPPNGWGPPGLLTEAAVTGVAAGLKDDDRSLGVLIPYARFQPTAGGAVGTNQTSRQQAQTRRFFRPGLLYAGRFTGAVARLAR